MIASKGRLSGEHGMANILIRDVDPKAVQRLKKRAKANGRSFQGELRVVVEQAAARPSPEEIEAIWKKWDRRFAGKRFDSSADLIRQDRDR
jgi:plasmid stability protein